MSVTPVAGAAPPPEFDLDIYAQAVGPLILMQARDMVSQGQDRIKGMIETAFGDENPGKKAVNVDLA